MDMMLARERAREREKSDKKGRQTIHILGSVLPIF